MAHEKMTQEDIVDDLDDITNDLVESQTWIKENLKNKSLEYMIRTARNILYDVIEIIKENK